MKLFTASQKDPKRKAAKGKDMLLHRCASFVANESGTARLASCGDSEVPKSTWAPVRVSSARARGKRPPEAQDPV